MNSSTCIEMVNGCPNLMSLALRGFKLHDHKIRILIKVVTFSFSINLFGFYFSNIYLDILPLTFVKKRLWLKKSNLFLPLIYLVKYVYLECKINKLWYHMLENKHPYSLLLQGFHHLKIVDFSTSYAITGTFLRFISVFMIQKFCFRGILFFFLFSIFVFLEHLITSVFQELW